MDEPIDPKDPSKGKKTRPANTNDILYNLEQAGVNPVAAHLILAELYGQTDSPRYSPASDLTGL